MLRDPGEHPRPDLVAIMECEDVVRPPVTRECFVRARLALHAPSDAQEGGEHTPGAGGGPGCHERTP